MHVHDVDTKPRSYISIRGMTLCLSWDWWNDMKGGVLTLVSQSLSRCQRFAIDKYLESRSRGTSTTRGRGWRCGS